VRRQGNYERILRRGQIRKENIPGFHKREGGTERKPEIFARWWENKEEKTTVEPVLEKREGSAKSITNRVSRKGDVEFQKGGKERDAYPKQKGRCCMKMGRGPNQA